MLIKTFFRRISKDFRQRELWPLKLIFFVQASTLHVLYPYLTIHMRELGINVEETAIMSAVTPLIAIVMPPLAGMLADKIGNFRMLLSFFSGIGGLAALLLLLVPIGRVTVQFPNRVVMDLGCPGRSGEMIYTMSQTAPCKTHLKPIIHTRIESCGYKCHMDDDDDVDLQILLTSKVYVATNYNFETGLNSTFQYIIYPSELPKTIDNKEDLKEHRKLVNNEHFETFIRPVSKNALFFPANQLYEFSCRESGFVEEFEANSTNDKIYENRTLCNFGQVSTPPKDDLKINDHVYRSKVKNLKMTEIDRLEGHQRYSVDQLSWTSSNFQGVTCSNPDFENEKMILVVPFYNGTLTDKVLTLTNCTKSCIVTAPRKEMCSNMDIEIEYNITLTFWLYLGIRVFIGIIGGTTFAMFEGAVIAILREQKADYGLQRIYGSIGGMISSPLSGLLIDYASYGKGYTDFRPAFYLYAALKVMSAFLMLTINLEFKAPANNVVSDVLTVLGNIEVVALFIACFILGTAWGYIESFLFWLIQDLGGSRSLMGITITVGGIAGIPLLALSGPIISKIGHANVLFIGFVFYAVRLFGYSIIYNPWLTLIFEAFESVTSSLSFTAAVTYAAKLSTTTTDSSIQGLLGGVYYGVGKGSGSLIGGYLMKAFGTRPTYQIFAVLSLVTGLMYFVFNMAYLKKRPQVEGNDIVKKEPKKAVQYQNGIDIIEIVMDATNSQVFGANQKIPIACTGIDNEVFVKEDNNEKSGEIQDTKDTEAIKNAKNLNEKSSIEEVENKKIEKVCEENRSETESIQDERKLSQSQQNTEINQTRSVDPHSCDKAEQKQTNKVEIDMPNPTEKIKQNGLANSAFEDDEDDEMCNITPEVLPKDENALSGLC